MYFFRFLTTIQQVNQHLLSVIIPFFDLVLIVDNSTNKPSTFQQFVTQTQQKGYATVGSVGGFGIFNFNELIQDTGLNLTFVSLNSASEVSEKEISLLILFFNS